MKHNWLDPFVKELPKLKGAITRFQGATTASVLVIAPPPTEVEEKENLAWCNPVAQTFFQLLGANVSLSPNDFLIMPAAFNKQTSKTFKPTSAEFGRTVLAAAAASKQIKGFVCAGGDAFKAYFGFGKKPNMSLLGGSVVKMQLTNFKPLLVLPDLGLLAFDPKRAKAEGIAYRDIVGMVRDQTRLIAELEKKQIYQKLEALCR